MGPEHWLYTIPLRLRSLFRWAQADQELDDELRDHLDRKTEEYVAQGMRQEEAHRRARLDGRYRADQREMPRRAQSELDSRLLSGFALWSAHVAQISRLRGDRHPNARAWHQCEHGGLFRGEWRFASPAGLPGAEPALPHTSCLVPDVQV